MQRQLRRRRGYHPQRCLPRRRALPRLRAASRAGLRRPVEGEGRLPSRHREIDVRQDLRVQQSPVLLAVRVVDPVPRAERIQAVALAGVQLPCEDQGVGDRAAGLDAHRLGAEPRQLRGVQPRERGVLMEEGVRALKQAWSGEAFTYRSPNTEVLGWLIARVTGKRPEVVLQERIWSRLGAEADAFIALDPSGAAVASGGLNCRLRDLARFGEMIRLQGRYNGQQIVPEAVIADIRQGGSPEEFAPAGYQTLPGWSYRKQWWIAHDDHGAFMARGIHGQAIYIDPKAEMVIARFASHPLAGNVHFDPTSLPAYRAIADQLLRKPR